LEVSPADHREVGMEEFWEEDPAASSEAFPEASPAAGLAAELAAFLSRSLSPAVGGR